MVTADINTTNFDNFTAEVKKRALEEPFNYDMTKANRKVGSRKALSLRLLIVSEEPETFDST